MRTRSRPVASYVIVVLLAVPATVRAQSGSVEGHVTNSVTGDFIPGATLRLMALRYVRNAGGGNAQPQTRSQADGSFRFESVTPGEYLVVANANGFVPNQLDTNSRVVDVAAGQTNANVSVLLVPGGSIAGRIEDEEGHAKGGIRIEALSPVTERGRTSLKQGSIATADQAGNFRLVSLQPGEYYLVAQPTVKEQQKEADLVRTFYPHALDFSGASTIQIAAGQTVTDVSLEMRRTSTYHIRGTISEAPPDIQTQRLTVVLAPKGAVDVASLSRSVQPAADRSFDFGHVVPGAYTLRLTGGITDEGLATGRRHMLLARQDVEVGGSDLDGISLALTPPITLSGHVALLGSNSGQTPNFARVRVWAKPLEDISHASQSFATIASDGTLTLARLNPGLYVINTAVNLPGIYVKSVSLNQRDVTNQEIDLSEAGAGVGQLDVLLSPGAGEVDGTSSSPGNAIVLAPEHVGPDGSGVLFAYARSDGSFSVANVPPGKYSAYAVDHADPNLWLNPDFLREIATSAAAVELAENGRQQIQLSLLSPVQVAAAAARLGLTVGN